MKNRLNKPLFLNYQDLKKAHNDNDDNDNDNDNDNNNNILTFNGVVQAFLH